MTLSLTKKITLGAAATGALVAINPGNYFSEVAIGGRPVLALPYTKCGERSVRQTVESFRPSRGIRARASRMARCIAIQQLPAIHGSANSHPLGSNPQPGGESHGSVARDGEDAEHIWWQPIAGPLGLVAH